MFITIRTPPKDLHYGVSYDSIFLPSKVAHFYSSRGQSKVFVLLFYWSKVTSKLCYVKDTTAATSLSTNRITERFAGDELK